MSKKVGKITSSRTSKKRNHTKSKKNSKIKQKTTIKKSTQKIEKAIINADVLRKNVDDIEKKLQLYVN
jgi:hypothetical protein